MDWETLSLSDIYRLIRAIEQAAGGKTEVIQGIIDRIPAEPLLNGHATIGTLRRLLEQLNGQLPEEVIALLRQQQAAPVTNQNQDRQPPRPPTFTELVAACRFTSIERGFTEEHFPLVDDGNAGRFISMPFYSDRNMMSIAPILTVTSGNPVGIKRALEFISSVTYPLEAYLPIAIVGARWNNRIPVILPGNRLALFDIRGRFRGKWRVLAAF